MRATVDAPAVSLESPRADSSARRVVIIARVRPLARWRITLRNLRIIPRERARGTRPDAVRYDFYECARPRAQAASTCAFRKRARRPRDRVGSINRSLTRKDQTNVARAGDFEISIIRVFPGRREDEDAKEKLGRSGNRR